VILYPIEYNDINNESKTNNNIHNSFTDLHILLTENKPEFNPLNNRKLAHFTARFFSIYI